MLTAAILTLYASTYHTGYLKAWQAHSEPVNSEAKAKQMKTENAVATGEQKAAVVTIDANLI